MIRLVISFALLLVLAGCSYPQEESSQGPLEVDPDAVVAKAEPLSETGNDPYVVAGVLYTPDNQLDDYLEQGVASWYGRKFHGKKTSSGEVYNMYMYTAAHKTLPIPSYVRVTNLANNKSLNIRVNDRGPFVGDRILDLSYAAARDLGFAQQGTTRVRIESISVIRPQHDNTLPDEGIIYLQTGVYAKKENALKLQSRLQSHGHQVKVEQRDDLLFSVKVGPFKTAALAFNQKTGLERSLQVPVLLITERP